jgi:5-methyltetrahydrofolate--homocysteine methyltransferase
MGQLLERLATKKILIADGAWGTMLQGMGMGPGDCPEEWNVSHAKEVQSVARAYQDAGADVILSDTFGGSRCKLSKMGLEDRLVEFNSAGAKNSLLGAPKAVIAASIGPTGEFLEPLGAMTESEMIAVFKEQMLPMVQAGITCFDIETMSALDECICAVKAAKSIALNIDVIVTMTFEARGDQVATMMGVTPRQAAEELTNAGADVIGANCGNGIDQMIGICMEMRAATLAPILIKSNAGMPELINGKTVFRQTPEQMAAKVPELIAAGATIIGGCCGTTPAHIAALRKAVDRR